MAGSRPEMIVDVTAPCAELTMFQFFAKAGLSFSGNVYDGNGMTIGTYSVSMLISSTLEMDVLLAPAQTTYFNRNDNNGTYGISDVFGIDVPTTAAANLTFNTAAPLDSSGNPTASSSPLGGVISLGRVNIN